MIRNNPKIDFFSLRDEAILLSEEEESVSRGTVTMHKKKTNEVTEKSTGEQTMDKKIDKELNVEQLLKVVDAQQKQIDSLVSLMKQQSVNKTGPGAIGVYRNRRPIGNIECYRCHKIGHVQRDCHVKLDEEQKEN